MPSSDHLHLVWNNHMSNMQSVLFQLYNHPSLADVTISCKDGTLKAHKIILSACSPYFETVFQENPCKHPVVILKETSRHEMQMLLQFMYKGSTDIPEEEMPSVVHTANELRVKGFAHAATGRNLIENIHIPTTENREVLKTVPLENKHPELTQNAGEASVDGSSLDCRTAMEHDLRDSDEMIVSLEREERHSVLHSNKENNTQTSEACKKSALSSDECDTKSPPYSTRFRGRKRVAVGFRTGVRSRSLEKKDRDRASTITLRSKVCKKTSSDYSGNSIPTKISVSNDTLRKKSGSDSEEERYMTCIPDIEIKEELDDSAEYSFIASDYDAKDCTRTEQFIKEEPVDYLERRDPDFLYFGDDDFESDHVEKKSSVLKPHECEFCELSFARASHLARHRRVHTGERPFSCGICLRTFSRQDKLKQHSRRHHPMDIQTSAQKVIPDKRKRGRPRKVPQEQMAILSDGQKTNFGSHKQCSIESELIIPKADRVEDASNMSLPFGDTSYLSSLSLGQQRYKDQVAAASSSSNAEDLLQTVRQLGECTIQTVSSHKF